MSRIVSSVLALVACATLAGGASAAGKPTRAEANAILRQVPDSCWDKRDGMWVYRLSRQNAAVCARYSDAVRDLVSTRPCTGDCRPGGLPPYTGFPGNPGNFKPVGNAGEKWAKGGFAPEGVNGRGGRSAGSYHESGPTSSTRANSGGSGKANGKTK